MASGDGENSTKTSMLPSCNAITDQQLPDSSKSVCTIRITYLDRVMHVSHATASLNRIRKVSTNRYNHFDLLQRVDVAVVDVSGIINKTLTLRISLTAQLSNEAFRNMIIGMLRKGDVSINNDQAVLKFSRTLEPIVDIESLFSGMHLYEAPTVHQCTHFVGDLSKSGVERVELLRSQSDGRCFDITYDVLSSSYNMHRMNQRVRLATTFNKMVEATAAVDAVRSMAKHGTQLDKAFVDIGLGKLLAVQTIAIRNYESAQRELVDYDNIQSVSLLGTTFRRTER